MRRQIGQRAAPHFFMQLGHFARHGGGPRAQHLRHAARRFAQALGGFEKDQGGAQAFEFFQDGSALARFGRQKAGEQKTVRRQARQHRPGQHRLSAGHGMDGDALLDGGAHQLEAGIGHQRRAGIADQGDARARFQLCQQPRPLRAALWSL